MPGLRDHATGHRQRNTPRSWHDCTKDGWQASAALGAIKRGLSKSMGYLKRKSHALSLAWLKEQVGEYLVKISTLVNGADVLTNVDVFWRHMY